MTAHFNPEALKFLRGLARNNDRAWFDPRKAVYEREIKAPMLAVIEAVNDELEKFAPEHVRPPHKSMMRIYRDTRFAADKRLEKTSGAGFYFHVSAKETVIAAGVYMPTKEQLLAIRRHIEQHHEELRAILAGRKLRAAMGELEGDALKRPPRGFCAESPAIGLLLQQQWGVSATLPSEIATQPELVKEIARRFALAAPMVHFLNAAL